MPAIVASLVRVLIQAAVQTGIFIILEKLASPIVDAAKYAVKKTFNMTDEEAEDSIANEIIDAFLMIGIIGVSIKTKMPTKVAEKLGFTSKGYVKRPVSKKLPTTAKGTAAKKAVDGISGKVIASTEATAAIETAIKTKTGFKAGYDLLIKTVGVTFMGFMVIGNWIDFGNWNNGAYQKSMQKFLSWISFGALVPDEDYRKSLTVSDEIFSKVYNTFKTGGALGIQDPYKAIEVPFTRDNLLDLTDQVGATLLLTDGSASAKKVLAATLPMIIFNTTSDVDSAITTYGGATTKTIATTTTQATTKVFTGIVSQGVVGAGLVFTSRPDDLIESAEELRAAASNNLALYLNTLLGKIVYEVKVVSSIITKDGFKQTGTTQRIQTGTYSNGTPKYKTVTNKFATIIVYAITDKGSRSKLTTIVLGPVDSAKLTVGTNDLRTLETELPSLVTTNDINEINEIKTETETVVTKKEETTKVAEEETTFKKWVIVSTRSGNFQTGPFNSQKKVDTEIKELVNKWANKGYTFRGASESETNPRLREFKGFSNSTTVESELVSDTTNSESSTITTVKKAGADAKTLYEWYQAQGQTLPSVSGRSVIYEGLGLGQRSYYTGTAEQNTKLLNALKLS